MGLTNLLTVGEEVRSRALQADCWRACRDLLFAENEQVQRAGLEALCNLTMAPEVLERFAEGRGDLEIKVFAGFCHAEDHAARVAASGALAMLAACDEVAVRIAANENFKTVLEALGSPDPDVQHRVVATVCSICEAEGCPPEAATLCRAALRLGRGKGFASREADAIARGLLDGDLSGA